MRLRVVITVFLLSISITCISNLGFCSQKTLDFIYIDSSVNEAAGGHAALRLDQTVFHFQYFDEGFFLLVKTFWDDFRYQYNDLQNRTLSIAKIPVSLETYQLINNQFQTRYLLQKKRFTFLEQLEIEKIFFQKFRFGKSEISIKGLGFFSLNQQDDPIALTLKDRVEKSLGESFLDNLRGEIDGQLKNTFIQLAPQTLKAINLDNYQSSLSLTSKIQTHSDLLSLREALLVLKHARPLIPEALLHLPEEISTLTGEEITKLQKHRDNIASSITHLLQSSRVDRGRILLLQTARYQAIEQSIINYRLTTLDPFPDDSALIQIDKLENTYISVQNRKYNNNGTSDTRTYLEQLKRERLLDAINAKETYFTTTDRKQIAYSLLETSFGRLWEIDQVDENLHYLRNTIETSLPDKSRQVQTIHSVNQDKIELFIKIATDNRNLVQEKLLKLYNYNLFDKNCVTELFETIYSGFVTNNQIEKSLGGYIGPGEHFSFVPFLSFSKIQQYFPVSSIEVLPSYRKRQAQELYEKNGFLSLLKESNTLTSTIYYSWQEDSAFLFFTDDSFLLRPVLGVGNIVYATMSSLGGLFTLPIDDGTLLQRSVKGILFSIPELGFVNIRKGTFPAIASEDQ